MTSLCSGKVKNAENVLIILAEEAKMRKKNIIILWMLIELPIFLFVHEEPFLRKWARLGHFIPDLKLLSFYRLNLYMTPLFWNRTKFRRGKLWRVIIFAHFALSQFWRGFERVKEWGEACCAEVRTCSVCVWQQLKKTRCRCVDVASKGMELCARVSWGWPFVVNWDYGRVV